MRVCVDVTDGKVSVGIEPPDGDADDAGAAPMAAAPGAAPAGNGPMAASGPPAAAPGPAAPDSYMQPAPDIDTALAMAKQMLEQGAQADQQDGEAAFQSGFAGVRGNGQGDAQAA